MVQSELGVNQGLVADPFKVWQPQEKGVARDLQVPPRRVIKKGILYSLRGSDELSGLALAERINHDGGANWPHAIPLRELLFRPRLRGPVGRVLYLLHDSTRGVSRDTLKEFQDIVGTLASDKRNLTVGNVRVLSKDALAGDNPTEEAINNATLMKKMVARPMWPPRG